MKTIKIDIPEGYEIDKEKSTFEEIILKKIEKKRPLSAKEVGGRKWYINSISQVVDVDCHLRDDNDNNCLSTKQRAEAFLALMQLVELRDAWNGEWKPDYTNWKEKWVVACSNGEISVYANLKVPRVLAFKSREIAEEFLEQFRDLIETAKELI